MFDREDAPLRAIRYKKIKKFWFFVEFGEESGCGGRAYRIGIAKVQPDLQAGVIRPAMPFGCIQSHS